MDYFVTKQGLNRAVELGKGKPGYVVQIVSYKIGDKAGFTIDDTMDNVQGGVMHTGTPIEVVNLGEGKSQFTIFMDETVGTWQFGNIGLFLEDGTMYAIGVLKRPQWKIAFPDKDFNRVRLELVSSLSQGQASVSLQVNPLLLGAIWELASPDHLPVADQALTNAYIATKNDSNNNPGLWVRKDKTWYSETFPTLAARGTVEEAVPNGLGFMSAALPPWRVLQAGSAVIRFTSGSCAGLVRRLTSLDLKVARWERALYVAPGDGFELLATESTATTSTTSADADDSTMMALLGL